MNDSHETLQETDPEKPQYNLTGIDTEKYWSNISEESIVGLKHSESGDIDRDTVPDGGYGWYAIYIYIYIRIDLMINGYFLRVVAFAGFLVCFMLYGMTSIWGIFSHAYATTILKDKATSSDLMMVGGFSIISLGLFSPVSPALMRFGARSVILLGAIIASLGITLSGYSTKAWHLWLTSGIAFGAGVSLVYITSISVIAQWFSKRRGIAMGISSAGTGIGGLSLAPFADYLIQKYGIAWAYRILGLLSFGVCLIVLCLMKTRSSPQNIKRATRSCPDFKLLKNFNFIIWLFGSIIALMGYYVSLFILPKYSAEYDISNAKSAIIVGVCCAANALGRITLGYTADYIGHLNMYIISTIISGLFCTVMWPFAKTFETIVAFAILFGFTCGLFFALAPPITATVVGQKNISSGFSIVFIASAISGAGPPIASTIQTISSGDSFIGVQMFAGATYLIGALFCIILKVKLSGSLLSIL
ncbi:MFS general substrate transporter [Backusella circina FSU 941]|nr:MFS general substrate transporter [Backusella circina FSU 941]